MSFSADCADTKTPFASARSNEVQAAFPTKNRPDSFTFGAVSEGGELLGVVSFEREGAAREKLRHKGLLFRMYVARAASGKGVGGFLIREVIRRAESLGDVEQINLTVAAGDDPAGGLYRSFGFAAFSIEKNAIKYKGKYFDEETMVLFL